jgi:alpha-ribazole phosphatase
LQTVLKAFGDVQSRQTECGHDALVVDTPCAGPRGQWLHLRAEGSRLRHQRPRGVRSGRQVLPRNAVWYASNLKRTHQTADAIWAAGFPKPAAMPHEKAFAEQHLGQLQGMNRKAFVASLPPDRHWLTTVDEPAPGGESFRDLYNRACDAIERITREQAGRDVIAVTHGGTIRAAIALALGGEPERGLAFDIDNCSVTRLDHLAIGSGAVWRLPMVNQQPWIADASHNAMHQPAGPEIVPETKLA